MLLVYLTVAWSGGILLAWGLWHAGALGCATPAWPAALLAAAAAFWAARRPPGRRLAALLLLAALLGAWRYQTQPHAACPTPADLAFYNGDAAHEVRAAVEGLVIGYPDVRDTHTAYRVRADTVILRGQPRTVRGDLLVQAPSFPEYRYGDRLRVTGLLQTPPTLDDFDYRAYLAGRGIHSLMGRGRIEQVAAGQGQPFWQGLFQLRARGSALLNRVLPEPAAALANGMLLGIESGIPADVDAAFTATGASHVIVISGSNIVLLSGVLIGGLSRALGRRRAVFPAMAGIALYVLLVGADPAALRAGVMGVLYILAAYLGRQSTSYVSLCAAALLMTAWNPLMLWDVGFQLSAAATLSLALFTRPIEAGARRALARRLPAGWARQAFDALRGTLLVTVAAQVLTLPLLVYHFGRLSLIAPVTNFLITPAQPPIMAGGMAALAFGLLWEPLGRALAVIPWLFLTYTTAVVRLTAAAPLASVGTGDVGRAASALYMAALIGGLLWRAARQRGWITAPARRGLAWAVAISAPLWAGWALWQGQPDGRLHLFYLPGAGGEAVLATLPDGRQAWLWDGRGRPEPLAAAGQPLLRAPRRGVAVAVGPAGASLWPAEVHVDPAQLDPGAGVRLAEGVVLARLGQGGPPALALAYGQFRTLWPPALAPEAQAGLLRSGADLRVTLLKAPGPETGAWPTAEFLAAAAPQVIFWPEETSYPPDVAAALTARAAARVPPAAIIEVITDGERLWVRRLSAGQARTR